MLKRLIEVQNLLQHQWELLDQSKLPVEVKAMLDKDNIAVTMVIQELIDDVETQKAAKGWVKGKGVLRFKNKDDQEVTVYRHPDFKGLMIHREFEGSKYLISHDESGVAIRKVPFGTMAKAAKACREVLNDYDWTRSSEDLILDPEFREIVGRLVKN